MTSPEVRAAFTSSPFPFDEEEGKRRLSLHGGEIYSVARAAKATQALFSAHDVLPFTYKKRQIKKKTVKHDKTQQHPYKYYNYNVYNGIEMTC